MTVYLRVALEVKAMAGRAKAAVAAAWVGATARGGAVGAMEAATGKGGAREVMAAMAMAGDCPRRRQTELCG